ICNNFFSIFHKSFTIFSVRTKNLKIFLQFSSLFSVTSIRQSIAENRREFRRKLLRFGPDFSVSCHTPRRRFVIKVKGGGRYAGLEGCVGCRGICAAVFGHDPAPVLYLFARPGGRAGHLPERIPQAAAKRPP